jgi:hypothetical protein
MTMALAQLSLVGGGSGGLAESCSEHSNATAIHKAGIKEREVELGIQKGFSGCLQIGYEGLTIN